MTLPSNPRTTKLLSEQERELVLYNFSLHEYGNDFEQQTFTQWESFKMCVLDIKSWMMVGILSTTCLSLYMSISKLEELWLTERALQTVRTPFPPLLFSVAS